jgi:hypothetical protein
MKVMLKNVRLSFPQLWAAVKVRNRDGSEQDGKPTFSCNLLLPENDPQVDLIEDAIEAAANDKWGDKGPRILAEIRAKDRTCLHNGNFKADYDGYAGMYFLTARTPTKPLVLDRDKRELHEADGKPYGGCYVNCSVDIYAQDHPKGGKRVNASFRGVQFVMDGDAFAAGPPADPDEFDDLGVPTGDAASLV